MDFSTIYLQLNNTRSSAVIMQISGPSRFQDKLTVGKNGRVYFERHNFGEAAGLVFSMWGHCDDSGQLAWDDAKVAYSGKGEAPHCLTGQTENGFYFDDKKALWQAVDYLKFWPKGGLGWLSSLISR